LRTTIQRTVENRLHYLSSNKNSDGHKRVQMGSSARFQS
jgi:hypothetical protein